MSEPATVRSTSTVLFTEAFGAFLLVLAVVGTALFAPAPGDAASAADAGVGTLTVALAAGLSVLAAMYAFGSSSGGHFNPAVTIGLAAAGRFSWRSTVGYVCAQVIGGALATTLIVLIGLFGPADWLQNAQDGGFASNGWGSLSPAGFDVGGVIIAEALLTAVFVMVFLGATHPERGSGAFAGLVIGLTFTLAHLVMIPIDNAGLNPARSIATAIYGGVDALAQLWVFLVFPIVGAVLAGLAYRALFDGPRRT